MPRTPEQIRAYKKAWKQANKDRLNAATRADPTAAAKRRARYQQNKDEHNAQRRALYAADPARWNASNPRVAYSKQKQHAKRRGIPFLLTFDEWRAIWEESGKFAERGCCKGRYVMARFGDKGGYEVGNVCIITHSQNLSDGHLGKPKPKRRRATHGSTSS